MTAKNFVESLEQIAASNDFASACEAQVEQWVAAGAGLDGVQAILNFMERYPSLDYGSPGPLVHFVEKFYRHGYEPLLEASVRRKPTSHTVWMLNRILNGASDASERLGLVSILEDTTSHPAADTATKALAEEFLRHASQGG